MKTLNRTIGLILSVVLCLSILPSASFAADLKPTQGNTDINILNGGTMLKDGESFYFAENGIFVQTGDSVRPISADHGKNLNLYNDYIYYTVGAEVRRVAVSGGESEKVHTASAEIRQLYVIDGVLRYLAGGLVFVLPPHSESAVITSAVSDATGLIPTEYGDILLTGNALNYTVWAKDKALISGVTSCYTDSGYLALLKNNKNYMIKLSKLFDSFDESRDMLDFNIHGNIATAKLLSIDEDKFVSEYNENNELQCDFSAMLAQAGLMTADPATETPVSPPVIPQVSEGQKNIVKRARQLHEIEWTPLEDRTQWASRGVFTAGTTYHGLPYGQPINNNGYVGYGVSLETYAAAMLDNTSKFYTTYSTYNKIAPAYSTDCSGFVSYAWALPVRRTTYSLPAEAERVGDQSVYSLQIGDCMNDSSSHVVLVSGVSYSADGNVIGVEIMEQTPVITKLTRYGEGETKSLAALQSYYLNGGYVIYRNPNRDRVTYTPSTAVPLDGEQVSGMKEKAPMVRVTNLSNAKRVELYSNTQGAVIYYTLNGSVPTTSSTVYSGAITVTDTTKIYAIAVSGNYSESDVLKYTVKFLPTEKPTASVVSGLSESGMISAGSKIKLSAVNGATIYYTMDGSEPSEASPTYSDPITLNSNTTIKARARANGQRISETAVFTYKVGAVFSILATEASNGAITPNGETKALASTSKTFKITPSDGYVIQNVLVDGVSVGAVSSYTFANISANHTISASFEVNGAIPFTDVAQDAWYRDAVGFAFARNLFNGTSATTFSPETAMTRGMFVTVLGRYAGLPNDLKSGIGIVTGTGVNIRSGPAISTSVAGFVKDKNTVVQVISKSGDWYQIKYGAVNGYIRNDLIKVYSGNYSDLASNQYYSPFVEWTQLTGIANGVAGGSFAANDSILREHMCVLLYNYASVYGRTLPQTVSKATFTDDASISAGAKTAVYALQQAGVINGVGGGFFAPQGTATRAQVAQIFMKFVNAINQNT
ncbi:MAG: chitobiase/beta-hexosaminidase C-terminal domain-containing protein [Oscillospiraceae bacterium]